MHPIFPWWYRQLIVNNPLRHNLAILPVTLTNNNGYRYDVGMDTQEETVPTPSVKEIIREDLERKYERYVRKLVTGTDKITLEDIAQYCRLEARMYYDEFGKPDQDAVGQKWELVANVLEKQDPQSKRKDLITAAGIVAKSLNELVVNNPNTPLGNGNSSEGVWQALRELCDLPDSDSNYISLTRNWPTDHPTLGGSDLYNPLANPVAPGSSTEIWGARNWYEPKQSKYSVPPSDPSLAKMAEVPTFASTHPTFLSKIEPSLVPPIVVK